ncbi:MAG TPA: alpha/beta fold hydrolase [Thermoanaerobaculia bacterium]|nr:alpha/beta fold hydrolase [Thermoanaerobaculia bacterium]
MIKKLAVLALVIGAILYFFFRPKEVDTRFSGAWRFPDGRIVGLSPTGEDGIWRVRDFSDGRVHSLYPDSEDTFTIRSGWSPDAPEEGSVFFVPGALLWRQGIGGTEGELRVERLPLREKAAAFRSGDTELRGRLILPDGPGPHPAVVMVHGSEKDAATVYSHEGWLLAPNGIAVLIFDKRGTGTSEGKFGMDFGQLSDDVVAAVEWLREQPEIDPDRIGLAGYSQGGWISPLAASKTDAVKFVLVGYGMVDSPAEEDRKETLHLLRKQGFGEADLAEAEELIKAGHEVIRQRFDGGWERVGELKARFKNERWVDALDDSTAGSLMRYPAWAMKTAGPRMMPRGLDRYWFYDSRPVLEKLDIPMLWLIGGDDIEAPNEATIATIAQLAARGKPFEMVVYPGADHGILLFEEKDGERVYTRYDPEYFRKKVEWLRHQTGLDGSAPTRRPPGLELKPEPKPAPRS